MHPHFTSLHTALHQHRTQQLALLSKQKPITLTFTAPSTLEPTTPTNEITNGDTLQLTTKKQPHKIILVEVIAKTPKNIRVQFAQEEEQEEIYIKGKQILARKTIHEKVYSQLWKNLEKASVEQEPVATMCQLTTPEFNEDIKVQEYCDTSLNQSQQDAVLLAMRAKQCALIHGPPGTGKTKTIVEVIRQCIKNEYRILVCAPSNIAVDNILERVAIHHKKVLRIGHMARVARDLEKYTLRSKTRSQVLEQLQEDIDKALNEKNKNWREVRTLRKEMRERENKYTAEVISQSNVIFSTLSGSGSWFLKNETFDLVIVDEACMSLEPELLLAAQRASKIILAGDPKQLGPVTDVEILKTGIFERVLSSSADSCVLLDTQYRMNQHIADWSSKEMYDSRLKSDASVATHLPKDLTNVRETENTDLALVIYSVEGPESPADDSWENQAEVDAVIKYLKILNQDGVLNSQIAIITPYNGQVNLLRSCISEDIEIGTVDGFQGREKEIIIISMVRSNSEGNVGFLKDERRMNVAVTRARRQVCIIADCPSVSRGSPFLARLVDWFSEQGDMKEFL